MFYFKNRSARLGKHDLYNLTSSGLLTNDYFCLLFFYSNFLFDDFRLHNLTFAFIINVQMNVYQYNLLTNLTNDGCYKEDSSFFLPNDTVDLIQ